MSTSKEFLREIEWPQWQPTHKLYAVLDCAQFDDDATWHQIAKINRNASLSLFEGTPDEGLIEVAPFILDVMHPSYPNIMPWLIAHEKIKPVVIWFVSPYTIDVLQTKLKKLMVVDLPGDNDAVLRFYDPNVFQKLVVTLNAAQKALFFTHVDKWWAWRSRKNTRLSIVKIPGAAPIMPVNRLVFDAAQMEKFSQLDVADFAHDVQAKLMQDQAKFKHVKGMSNQSLSENIQAHIDQSAAYGLETEEGVEQYLKWVAATLGWSFSNDAAHAKIVATLGDDKHDEETKLNLLGEYCAKQL